MPTETQHLEQRVAALQSDLNERDQRTDDLSFQLKDREGSRRDWFDEAQRLEKETEELKADIRFLRSELRIANDTAALGVKMLAERDALLREVADEALFVAPLYRNKAQALLSASAEPSAPVEMQTLGGEFMKVVEDNFNELLLKSGAPVERDERAEFEQAFVVQEGVFFSKERNEYRSMNGRSIEYTDATDLNLRLQGWQARAALERKKDNCELCGVTGIEPCTDCPGLDKATEGASHE